MKIIHCADIHLGSKIEAKLPKDKADVRRREVRTAFSNMVDFAKNEGACAILLSGDVFDSACPFKNDKEYFYGVVRKNVEITFYYLRGNHDNQTGYEQELPNLKLFSNEWQSYDLGEVVISAIETGEGNARSLYSTLNLQKNRCNIVMLHGQVGSEQGEDKVDLSSLRNKNIDYLALGHIHRYEQNKLDERGVWAYSGCLEGRGFDECGQKGFVLLNIENGKITPTFIKNSIRIIHEIHVDITDCHDAYDAQQTVLARAKCSAKDLVCIVLEGEIDFDNEGLDKDVADCLEDKTFFVNVKDKTTRKFNVAALAGDVTLKGEFIRAVLGDTNIPENEKSAVIALGLRALSGREV